MRERKKSQPRLPRFVDLQPTAQGECLFPFPSEGVTKVLRERTPFNSTHITRSADNKRTIQRVTVIHIALMRLKRNLAIHFHTLMSGRFISMRLTATYEGERRGAAAAIND